MNIQLRPPETCVLKKHRQVEIEIFGQISITPVRYVQKVGQVRRNADAISVVVSQNKWFFQDVCDSSLDIYVGLFARQAIVEEAEVALTDQLHQMVEESDRIHVHACPIKSDAGGFQHISQIVSETVGDVFAERMTQETRELLLWFLFLALDFEPIELP